MQIPFAAHSANFYRSYNARIVDFIEVYVYPHGKNNEMMTVRQLLSILSSRKEALETNDLASFVSRYEEPLINLDSKMAQVVIGESGVVVSRQYVKVCSRIN